MHDIRRYLDILNEAGPTESDDLSTIRHLVIKARNEAAACGAFAGQCEGTTADLVEALKAQGIDAQHVRGAYYDRGDAPKVFAKALALGGYEPDEQRIGHEWAVVDDLILDPTREQFGSSELITSADDPHYEEFERVDEIHHMRIGEAVESKLPHVFYHATSTVCLDKIKQQGLLADPADRVYPKGHNSQSSSGVYLAGNFHSVLLHATNAVAKFGGKPLVFIIAGDVAQTNMDEDHLQLFMQDFLLDVLDIGEEEIPQHLPRALAQLNKHYTETFDQPAPAAELAAWFKHVVKYGDERRTAVYHRLIDAVSRKTAGALLDWIPAEDQSVRYIGNVGFTGSPRIIGALVIDEIARKHADGLPQNLQRADGLPAYMLFGNATDEMASAPQIRLRRDA